MQQKLGKRLLIGPIDHPTDTNLKIYLNYAVLEQHYWLTRLFDDPLLLLIFMLIVSLPFITFLSWSLSKPVRALKNSADRVASGHWDNLPEIKGPLEFRAVGLSFQRMIFIIKKNQTEKNQLFANLSHELRTPLARIGLSNALIRRKYPELKNEIVRIEQNLLALETRIQAMLSLSKAQMLEKENLEPLLLEDILMPIIEEAQFEAHQHQLKFNWSKIPAIEINGNLSLLQSAIENILRNALRFAKKKVDLEISLDNNTVILKISDDGKGVLPEELEFIFTPFYRSEQQENDHHGAGLGLAIAKLALEVHKGSISAANQTSGLCIILTLPVHKLNQK
ncbi:hypothetical protein AwWohl_07760 [Gammaproteobacteria bacterium]|nr:hypothetical protein AwWohl_07760 [Gammaproteobacteria bacterium]